MAGATPQTQQSNQFDELKEIVSATLEKKGILAKAQAQLRKHVFEALSVTEQENEEHYNVGPKIDENDINDKFAMALIRDFLSYHHLDYTLSLMNTESQKKLESTQNITRNEIASRLGLPAQKPNPDSSLLKQLVIKLFDNDVLKPRHSTLTNDIKLKPRASNDSYRSTLDSVELSANTIVFKQQNESNQDDRNVDAKKYTNPLENLTFSLPTSSDLPPITSTKKPMNDTSMNGIKVDDIDDNEDEVDISILEDEEEINKEKLSTIDIINDYDDLLDSSSNNDQDDNMKEENEENEENEDEELIQIEQMNKMNKTMEELRQQTSEFEKLKKESISPSQSANSSQTVTEYEDDFGSDEHDEHDNNNNNNVDIDDIEEDIDEDIDEDIQIDDENHDNIYSAKEVNDKVNDEEITKDFKLENVADIIMDIKTEKIKFQL